MNCLKHGYDWPHDKTCPYCDAERLETDVFDLTHEVLRSHDAIERLTAEVTRITGLYEREEHEHGETVDQRDRIEDLATSLANLVGEAYGVDVGEHSNSNCPITEACEELNYVLAMRQAVREPDEVIEKTGAEASGFIDKSKRPALPAPSDRPRLVKND